MDQWSMARLVSDFLRFPILQLLKQSTRLFDEAPSALRTIRIYDKWTPRDTSLNGRDALY